MTGLQVLASLVMSFFIPGLGQFYQSTFDPARRKPAIIFLAAFAVCVVTIVGWIVLPFLWVWSFIECAVKAPTAVAAALVLCVCGLVNAQQPPPPILPNEALPCWEYDMQSNTFHQVIPTSDGTSAITMTWTPQGVYQPATPSDPEPCCACTKDSPCNHAGCKHGVRCKCCKKEASTASFEPSACKSGACGQGSRACSRHRRAAERTIGGRRLFLRRDGCRSCR